MKRFTIIALLCTWFSTLLLAQSVAAGSPANELYDQCFEIVWRTVKEKHFDPTLGGVDWDKVREQYAPRVKEVKSDQELYTLLQKMLDELKQSHFRILSPEAVVQIASSEFAGSGVGLDLRLIDGRATITQITPDSSAARAGLRPGYVITEVEQTTVEQLGKRFEKSNLPPARVRLNIMRALLGQLSGKLDTSVRLVYLDEKERPHEVTLKRQKLPGEMSLRIGNFPPHYTEFEARRLADGIGYIRFNIFVPILTARITEAIQSMADAPGIIFDLRGNPGGIGTMANHIAGYLESRTLSLGRMTMRQGYMNFNVVPCPNPYTGKVIILLDGASGSTSEVFSSGMQENGRAIIIGERSVGAALPSTFEKLPTGALFQYAIADFKTPKGVLVEGRGVLPDLEVRLTRKDLLNGRDAQLEAAINEVRKQSASQSKKAA